MYKSKLTKVIVSLLRRILGVTRSGAKRLMRAMLRTLAAMARRSRLPVAGFVLPTVTMVLLVVILLTVAIVLRSFDRANTARNVRVNQQVLAAATPALDRAKAKIQFMLDQTQGRGTPSDTDLYREISNALGASGGSDSYTFGDEERLLLRQDQDGDGFQVTPPNANNFVIERNDEINTAWRYPVDTNNDGSPDTFTLYGIFFRTPPRDNVRTNPTFGDFTRERKPLEARTPPMSVTAINRNCAQGGGTVASLAGDSGWYRIDGKLKKSFFVYTVNVPMTGDDARLNPSYKEFTGTRSFSALEYQQDQNRIPIANNAVVYEDDLDISPGPNLNLNGRVFTNSNLLMSGANNANSIRMYLVSSPDSCYYDQENSKMVVAGNLVNGFAANNTVKNPVDVHLFRKKENLPASSRTADFLGRKLEIKTSEQSATNPTLDVLYNNQAYAARLSLLVAAQIGDPATNPPEENPNDPPLVQQQVREKLQTREQALTEYFKSVTRKVPFAEVPLNRDATAGFGLPWSTPPGTSPILGSQTTLRPIDAWNIPSDANTGLSLNTSKLEATNPNPKPPEEETFLGDRVVVGNNLPAKRWNGIELSEDAEQVAAPWNPSDPGPRERSSQVTKIANVGSTDRGGFWEQAAAKNPRNLLDGEGGLRIITGAGVYERLNSFLPPPSWIDPSGATSNTFTADTATYDDPTTPTPEQFPVVWPDSMPMSPLGPGAQVYNNDPGLPAGSSRWLNWPGTSPAPGTAQPPGGLPPEGLPLVTLPGSIDPNTPQYAKGDLRMRATVVYHYAGGTNPTPAGELNDQPIACISSYYDPSTASTARNLSTLPTDLSGDPTLGVQGTQIGSNNGITYDRPYDSSARPQGIATDGGNGLLSGSGDARLDAQANLVFPDGRFANEPLRKAIQEPLADRTLADKAAIDSTMCALGILDNSIGIGGPIPDGAIREVAFLDAREVKALDRDDWDTPNVNEAFTLSSPPPANPQAPAPPSAVLTGNYNLPLEERQPLEIRATRIDLEVLRTTPFGTDEFLLPKSGIIYASRDDALPDRSFRPGLTAGGIDETRSKTVSPTDSRLDPTRKPDGILLVRGENLGRASGTSPTVADVVREKGLTLASNLPVYIQGPFNLHTSEEFTQRVFTPTGSDFSIFYDRTETQLDPNFACRPNDPRLGGRCGTGDTWRPANILSDSINLLSVNYRFGFRNEGDFDLRNNAGAAAVMPRKQQGFYNNNFVTNGLSSGAFRATNGTLDPGGTTLTDDNYANNNNPVNSSYFNNFVTPVQRRGNFSEYVMEVCNKLPVSACTENDWYVNPVTGGKATVGEDIATNNYIAGTTAIAPTLELQRFPRRVAFRRSARTPAPNPTDPLDLPNPNAPVPLGVSGTTVADGPGTNFTANSLWFATTNEYPPATDVTYGSKNLPFVFNQARKDGSGAELPQLATNEAAATAATVAQGSQPLLMPVLQIQTVTVAPTTASASVSLPAGTAPVKTTGWLPRATNTTFNMVAGSNDTPSRSLGGGFGDFNGGLQNLPRFAENWGDVTIGGTNDIPANIQGSFIQFNRSAYSTAPYQPILNPNAPQQQPTTQTRLQSLFDPPPSSAVSTLNPSAPAPVAVTYNGGAPQPLYRTDTSAVGNRGGRSPFFTPPARNWGFDVGLLSQPADLFTRKFTTPPSTPTPNEYFREVPRDDEWVRTLMCAELASNGTKALTSPNLPNGC